MASKPKAKSTPAKSAPAVAGKKKKSAAKGGLPVFMVGSIVMAAVFLPSSVLLTIGMMPTIAVLFADPSHAKTKVVTVGALNLAGCVPFLLELWTQGYSLDKSFTIVSDPKAIIVMYAAAAIGYIFDWSLSAIVASVLYQRGIVRQELIRKRQEELALRWGPEVTGQLPLDHYGFAVEQPGKDH